MLDQFETAKATKRKSKFSLELALKHCKIGTLSGKFRALEQTKERIYKFNFYYKSWIVRYAAV